jgi:hypothetical protein
MATSVILNTTDGKQVDATSISKLSSYLTELDDLEEDGNEVVVIIGNPDTVHQQTLDAVEAIIMLSELSRLLNEFNYPVKQEGDEITLDEMKDLHDTITRTKPKWKELSENNEVYDWLMPLTEYIITVSRKDDVYSYYCKNAIGNNKNDMFRWTCEKGHLEVAQWLVSLGGVNIHVNDDMAFLWICEKGHLEVAQWLVSLGGVNIHVNDDLSFRYACVNGHLKVAQWLYSLGGVNIHAENDWVFKRSYHHGYREVAIWLYSLDGVDIHEFDDEFVVYQNEYMNVATWLRFTVSHDE